MVLPDEERQQRHPDHTGGGDLVGEQWFSGEHREQLRHNAEPGQRHDVHLGMAEEPEEVLPEERAASVFGDVEGGLGRVVEDAEQARGDQGRSGQGQEGAGGEDRPHEDGDPAPGHTRGPVVDDRHRQVEAGRHHAQADDGESDQVGHHAHAGLGLERRIAGPAGRKATVEQGGEDDEVTGAEDPEAEGLHPGECGAPGADHQGNQPVAQRSDDDRGGHHHHDGPVLAHHRDIGPGPNTWLLGERSSVRMAMASRPPVKKKVRTPMTYWSPTTLWSAVYRKYLVQLVDS